MNTQPQRRIIRLPEVCERIGLGKTANLMTNDNAIASQAGLTVAQAKMRRALRVSIRQRFGATRPLKSGGAR